MLKLGLQLQGKTNDGYIKSLVVEENLNTKTPITSIDL